MRRLMIGTTLAALVAGSARGQAVAPTGGDLTTREAIDAAFRREVATAERARLARLVALAAGQAGDEAARTHEELFRFAITTSLYAEAEPAAEAVVRANTAPPEVKLLAEMVNIVAEANRGAYDDSLRSLTAAIAIREAAERADDPAANAKVGRALPLASRLSLVNVYVRRLVQAGRYDVATKALTILRDSTKEPAMKALAEGRLAQLGLVGKAAPAIEGGSLGGKAVRLADLKGDVVLVVFWASWCLPNAEEVGRLDAIEATYRAQGFRIIGINLDSAQDGGVPAESILPNVRRFILEHNVGWPNLINGQDGHDYAKAYGVTEIPANALIGRDGTVVRLDVSRATLADAVRQALGR